MAQGSHPIHAWSHVRYVTINHRKGGQNPEDMGRPDPGVIGLSEAGAISGIRPLSSGPAPGSEPSATPLRGSGSRAATPLGLRQAAWTGAQELRGSLLRPAADPPPHRCAPPSAAPGSDLPRAWLAAPCICKIMSGGLIAAPRARPQEGLTANECQTPEARRIARPEDGECTRRHFPHRPSGLCQPGERGFREKRAVYRRLDYVPYPGKLCALTIMGR